MSIKSLLQVILVLLIVIIIGGIYYVYFYSKPLSPVSNNQKTLVNIENSKDKTNLIDEVEMLDNQVQKKNTSNVAITDTKETEINKTDKKKLTQGSKKIENLSKDIEYISTNRNGDIFKIIAKRGRTNIKNTNILDLEGVNGVITSNNRSDIFLNSENANYNYTNQDTSFYGNVEINYDDKKIKCDNFDLNIKDNIAVAYSNVIITNKDSYMKAQMITLNILTKDININSHEKIKIVTN
tara:strand:- start:435 stop:1151 length:717 start_codon:yes stop_codon:yes gene_type:complete